VDEFPLLANQTIILHRRQAFTCAMHDADRLASANISMAALRARNVEKAQIFVALFDLLGLQGISEAWGDNLTEGPRPRAKRPVHRAGRFAGAFLMAPSQSCRPETKNAPT
jgi:hypothetical protein